MNRITILSLSLLPLLLSGCGSSKPPSSANTNSSPSNPISSSVSSSSAGRSSQSSSEPSSNSASSASDILVQQITLNQISLSLEEGESFDLVASIYPANATNKNLVYSSSNKDSVSVDQNGHIVAVKAGYSIVLVLSQDGNASASCYVSVSGNVAVAGVSLNKESATLEEGQTLQLRETVSPYNANNKSVTWSSSNPDVANVSSSGLVTALSIGEADITVTTTDGGFSATCSLNVVEKENFAFEVGDTAFTIYTKQSTYLTSHYLHIITPITNTGNVNIYLNSASYDIYDANENPLMSVSQYFCDEVPSILAPGETGYFTVDRTYSEEVFEGLSIVPHISIKNAKNYKLKRYTLSNIAFSLDNYGHPKAIGKVKNELNEEGSTLDSVHIVLFDQNGNYLVTLSDYMDSALASGEEAVFEATTLYYCDISDASQIGDYVAFGEFYQLVL